MKKRPISAAVALIVVCFAPVVFAGWSLDVESGVAFSGYNDVRIPGNTGTEISLTDDLESDETAFVRGRITADLGERHRVSLLVAPLRIEAAGSVNREVDYNGVRFPAAAMLHAKYRFDSYRLTYSYALIRSDHLRFDLGLTAKIRDAAIRLESDNQVSEKSNTGFVPLINFALDWAFAPRFGLLFQGDALAAPQGRAEDVLLALYVDPTDNLRLRAGYRLLEGGADNDEVYSFALVNYASAGVTWTF